MSSTPSPRPEPVDGKVLIGGEWYERDDRLESLNPATEQVIGTVPRCNAADVAMAVEAARRAFPPWAETSLEARFACLERLRSLVARDCDALASLITQENGKPLVESHSVDVGGSLDLLTGLLRGGAAYLRDRRARTSNPTIWTKSHTIRRVPLGVVGVISPWNLPLSIPVGQIAMALAAGNTVVFKPSELAPLVGVKLATLVHRAGFPPGVFNMVTGDKDAGAALVEAPIDGLLFTGSTTVGHAIQARLGPRMIPTEMELGGKDAFLVLPDANFERTVRGAVWSGCFGTGQACSSSERFFVPRSWMDRFPAAVAEHVQALKVGNGMDEMVQVGPLASAAQRDKVEAQVSDAVARGARVLCGGKRGPSPGYFFEPTVLVDVPLDCPLMREETFGPVIPIVPYDDLETAIGWCEDTPYGLSASIWTSDADGGAAIARRLRVGSVWVNDSSYTHSQAQCPWGGMKGSGRGRTHWVGSLNELTVPQLIAVERGRRPSELWWYPYTPESLALFRRYGRMTAEGLLGKAVNLVPLLRDLLRVRGSH